MGAIHRLTNLRIRKITKIGRFADGGGLYLQVSKWGSKSWIFRFSLYGKNRHMGLGSLNDLSLAEAREWAAKNRGLLKHGIDPIDQRNQQRRDHLDRNAPNHKFRECAEAFIAANESQWKNHKHRRQWRRTLELYAYPTLGDTEIDKVTVSQVLKALEPIWLEKTETASRLRGRIETVLDWAAARGYRGEDNPARWKGHLDKILPKKSKTRRVVHHPSLPYQEIGKFIEVLREANDQPAKALEFLILTAARTSEVLNATWGEIDLANRMWVVPALRMKNGRQHRVPLSEPTLQLLDELPGNRSSQFIFESAVTGRQLSNMSMLQWVKRSPFSGITVHGFRSTFRDWVAEQTDYPREVAEYALAHSLSDRTEAAYQRSDLFFRRVNLMEDWARHCSENRLPASNIANLRT